MAIVIKVGGVDKSAFVDWRSVVLLSQMTNQIDIFNFNTVRFGTKTFRPALLDDVEFIEDGTTLYSGKVVEIEDFVEGSRKLTSRVTCKDNSHEMDKNLIVKTYDGFGTAEDIVRDVITFLPAGFTEGDITAPVVVNYVRFNYEQPSKVFQQLAELIGFDWFVDEDKKVQFFSKDTSTAPFGLTDTNDKYFFNTLVIREDVKNLRNTIFVRGGTFRGDLFTEIQEADGDTKTFTQGFRYSSIVVELDTGSGFVALTVGIDNIDPPATKDVLYNFNEKAVKFRDDNKPAATDLVKVEGLPHIPVIILTKDNVSIGTFGAFEHKIIDKSINSKEGARDRALQEILQWASEINEGSFTTIESGLRVGQRISINSAIRNINRTYIISRITTRMQTPTSLINDVILISTQTFGHVEFLQKLLIQKDKEIEIFEDEVLDKIEAAIETIDLAEVIAVLTEHNAQVETITMGEAAPVVAKDAGTCFVYGPFPIPSGVFREGKYDGATYCSP